MLSHSIHLLQLLRQEQLAENSSGTHTQRTGIMLCLAIGMSAGALVLPGCAASYSFAPASTVVNSNGSGTAIGDQNLAASALIGAHVTFRSADYYNLFNPGSVSKCAGDANTFYDPFALNSFGTPAALDQSVLDSTTTIRPAFIKNVSLDMTDSNLNVASNLTFSCSYGTNTQVPAPSNCATFDNLANSFISVGSTSDQRLLVGGTQMISPYSVPQGNQIVRAGALIQPFSVILPPAALNLGKVLFIEKTDSSTNAITITATGSDTLVDTATTSTTLTSQFQYLGFKALANTTSTSPADYWAKINFGVISLTTANSPYTLTAGDNEQVLVNSANGAITITLPTAAAAAGQFYYFRKSDSSSNLISVTPQAGDDIIDANDITYSSGAPYVLSLPEPEVVLLSISNGAGGYFWTTQNPEPIGATVPYSIVADNQFVLVDGTNSSLTLNLPSATANPGKILVIERLDNSANTITLNPVLNETILNTSSTSTTLPITDPLLTLVSTITTAGSLIYYWNATTGIPYTAFPGYNTGYYTTFDTSCVGSGPVASTDPTINSTYIGGVYFDIDRTQLGPNENLLLNITYYPLESSDQALNQTNYTMQETPILEVHLVSTGQSSETIQSITQPRILTYGSTTQYPQIAQKLAVFGNTTGQIQQQQVYLPIAMNPSVDRIQVQRYTGNIIFIDATLFRLGYR